MKDKLAIVLAVLVGSAVAGAIIAIHHVPRQAVVQTNAVLREYPDLTSNQKSVTEAHEKNRQPFQHVENSPQTELQVNSLRAPSANAVTLRNGVNKDIGASSAEQKKSKRDQKEVADAIVHGDAVDAKNLAAPEARVALSLVGVDPDAERTWEQAINDPSVLPDERKQLIHDLNDDGLSDEHNPTQDDVPLILNRLELIGQLAPNAVDDVNAAAFDEAYRDLMKDLARAYGQ